MSTTTTTTTPMLDAAAAAIRTTADPAAALARVAALLHAVSEWGSETIEYVAEVVNAVLDEAGLPTEENPLTHMYWAAVAEDADQDHDYEYEVCAECMTRDIDRDRTDRPGTDGELFYCTRCADIRDGLTDEAPPAARS